jgi:hypothetical protein
VVDPLLLDLSITHYYHSRPIPTISLTTILPKISQVRRILYPCLGYYRLAFVKAIHRVRIDPSSIRHQHGECIPRRLSRASSSNGITPAHNSAGPRFSSATTSAILGSKSRRFRCIRNNTAAKVTDTAAIGITAAKRAVDEGCGDSAEALLVELAVAAAALARVAIGLAVGGPGDAEEGRTVDVLGT